MDTNLSFSSEADDEYLLRAVNAIEENEATYVNIRDLELASWLDENSNSNDASLLVQPSAVLREELAEFRDHWNAKLAKSSRGASSPSPPPLAQPELAEGELADVLRQIDAYESQQLPCAPPGDDHAGEVNVGASTSALVEVPPLKRQLKSSKGKEKAKKMATENGWYKCLRSSFRFGNY